LNKSLEIRSLSTDELYCTVNWEGLTLSPSIGDDSKVTSSDIGNDEDYIEIHIKYIEGQYQLIVTYRDPGPIYYKLAKDQNYFLICDDIIVIGSLEFQV
jgi:hypothetical protein